MNFSSAQITDKQTSNGAFSGANPQRTLPAVPVLQKVKPEEELPLQGKLITQLHAAKKDETQQTKANNTGLPDDLKSGIENLSGYAMDDVQVHYNSPKPAQLHALAYAQGSNIHIAPGQEQHLPHEAWHVVQQKQGRVQPTKQMKEGVAVNDDKGLESEADVMGAKALSQHEPIKPIHYCQPNTRANDQQPAQRVITRAMSKIINETEFKTDEDMGNTYNWLASKYGSEVASIIVNAILDKKSLNVAVVDEINDQEEMEINMIDHGGLAEYDDPMAVDQYISSNQITQFARKGNTETGPKSYATINSGNYKDVSYLTDGKGAIDFSTAYKQKAWTNPVLPGSEVNLSKANKVIDKKNRAQHFAIGDFLYSKNTGKTKASDTTNLRKGKWTWHHMPDPYKMVLVDMTVHAKHGHNGGVYLW